jgi:hypothetical protein
MATPLPTATMAIPVLEVTGLRVSFFIEHGEWPVVSDVSFSVAADHTSTETS